MPTVKTTYEKCTHRREIIEEFDPKTGKKALKEHETQETIRREILGPNEPISTRAWKR